MIVAVHVTKTTKWRNKQEEFENVYHFDTPTINTESGYVDLVNQLVAAEKLIHTSAVTFKQARVHGPTNGTKEQDIMRAVVDLSGTGSASPTVQMAAELCYVASFYVGRSAKGYKRFLRKFLHTGAVFGSGATDFMAFGRDPLGANQKTLVTNFMNDIKTIEVATFNNDLCTPQGTHLPLASSPIISDYVHTRQFKRGRKESSTP